MANVHILINEIDVDAVGDEWETLVSTGLTIVEAHRTCSRCGVEKPISEFGKHKSGRNGIRAYCRVCAREEASAYAKAHPEKCLAAQRRRRKADPQKHRDNNRRYRERHLEEVRARDREYAANHRDEANARVKAWKHKNPERARSLERVHVLNRRDRARGLPTGMKADDWQRALSFFDECCAVCGARATHKTPLCADHWIAANKSYSPGAVPENIVPLCKPCNSRKLDRDALEWLLSEYEPVDARLIFARIQEYLSRCKK